MIGEIRDLETAQIAVQASLTGHLVLATLHTNDTAQSIGRMIDVFPAGQQGQIRTQLAGTLEGVIAQTLLPTADGLGRVAAVEVLAPDDAVRNLIRQAKIEQVYSIMQTGGKKGMHTMEQALAELVLRPPDLRHLDAAFQAMSASPRGQTSLKVAVGEPFTTRCATCGRTLPLDEVIWPGPAGPDDVTEPAQPFSARADEPAGANHAPNARETSPLGSQSDSGWSSQLETRRKGVDRTWSNRFEHGCWRVETSEIQGLVNTTSQ